MADGDIADNWEEFDDSGALDKQLETFQKITILKKPPSEPTPPPTVMEDGSRTAFTPQVKILKRQHQPLNDPKTLAKSSTSKPSPSLAEREAAYAEARQRIFGSDNNATSQASPQQQQPQQQQQQQHQQQPDS